MAGSDNKELFGKHGLKNTKHRNLVYDILTESQLPLTIEHIYLKLKDVDTSISFSTVYRILDTFVSKGIALKSSVSDANKAMFELNRMEHKHRLVCISCKKMIAVQDCPLERYEKSLEKKTQFDITAHNLEIFGYCPACKVKE